MSCSGKALQVPIWNHPAGAIKTYLFEAFSTTPPHLAYFLADVMQLLVKTARARSKKNWPANQPTTGEGGGERLALRSPCCFKRPPTTFLLLSQWLFLRATRPTLISVLFGVNRPTTQKAVSRVRDPCYAPTYRVAVHYIYNTHIWPAIIDHLGVAPPQSQQSPSVKEGKFKTSAAISNQLTCFGRRRLPHRRRAAPLHAGRGRRAVSPEAAVVVVVVVFDLHEVFQFGQAQHGAGRITSAIHTIDEVQGCAKKLVPG